MLDWDKMSLTQKLIWLKNRSGGKGPGRNELVTVTGSFGNQFSLTDAVNGKRIKTYKEYGFLAFDRTPSPTAPCNFISVNGNIKVRRNSSTDFYGDDPQTITLLNMYGELMYEITNVQNLYTVSEQNTSTIYYDEQDFITGDIIRRVGIRALNGSENIKKWTPAGTSTPTFLIEFDDKAAKRMQCRCTHFPLSKLSAVSAPNNSFLDFDSKNVGIKTSMFANVDELRVWLSEQRATEHPVIFTYLLAEEKHETVPGNIIYMTGGGCYAEPEDYGGNAMAQYYKLITE